MDLKIGLSAVCYLMLIITAVSCGQNTGDHRASQEEVSTVAMPYDEIIFATSNREYVHLGKRLYPTIGLDSSNQGASKELIALEGVGDTIFAFLNSELLYNINNPRLPFASDSLLRDYYPIFYDVEIDDDLPYIAYLNNSKDHLQFIKEKGSGDFYIEKAIIRDTLINVIGEVMIGMKKADVLRQLGIPIDLIDKEGFALILCHADSPTDKIWYKHDLKLKPAIVAEKNTIKVLLRFEEGTLKLAYISFWIGYGDYATIPELTFTN